MLLQDVVNQKHLEKVIRSLYPNDDIYTNFRDVDVTKSPKTGQPLEVDICIPSLQLCFEFQDIYHYTTAFYAHAPLQIFQDRDSLKKQLILQRKETLIVVPYWWTGDKESLRATIQFQEPSLSIDTSCDPIPFNPPFQENANVVPSIGELMLASFPQYLNVTMNGTLWWIGEKYDGIRFCWHPLDQIAYSRNGIPLAISEKVKWNLGNNLFIDGEFWSGRGSFPETTRLLYSQQNLLASSKFIAFDIPNERHKYYETRYATLINCLDYSHPFLTIPVRTLCNSVDFVLLVLDKILEYGGEGVILQQFNSKYESGRSTLLHKIKTAMATDEEALVVKSTSTHLLLQLPSGDTFSAPHTSTTTHIKKGEVVTVSNSGHTQHHTPIDPIITKIRHDITWQQVLANYNSSAKVKAKRSREQKEIKMFFDKFAMERNFDPLVAANWYKITKKQIEKESDGKVALQNYSFVGALKAAYPQIGLKKKKFLIKSGKYWGDERNQRKFIQVFAKQHGFDPLIAENWFSLDPRISKKLQQSYVIRVYYAKNLAKAIHHLFPEIGLKNKLIKRKLRRLLTEYASSKDFDPLVPESWYQFKLIHQKSPQEIQTLVEKYYGNNWISCVTDAFPELHLDATRFQYHSPPESYWRNEHNQRNFFVYFAKARGFDPLVPRNWYKITPNQIKDTKYGESVLGYFNGSHTAALRALFPDIGLKDKIFEEDRLSESVAKQHWLNRQRQILENYAKTMKFDPLVPGNWHYISISDVFHETYAKQIRSSYKTLQELLVDVFPSLPPDFRKFCIVPRNHWKSLENRKKVFDMVAKRDSFDPLIAENWNPYKKDPFLIKRFASYYNNSFDTALQDVYPSLHITPH